MSEDARRLTTIDPRDLLLALRRRPGWLITGLGAGLLLGVFASTFAPPVYRSEATLLVESRWFPQDFMNSPLGKSMRDRLQTLKHRLTADRTLAEVVERVGPERFGSFPSPEARAASLRGGFEFEIEDAASPEAAIVRVGYRAPDPTLARDVVAALTLRAVEERREEGARQAAATAEVLRSEIDQLRASLEQKAERLQRLAAQEPMAQTGVDPGEDRRAARLGQLTALQELEAEVARAEAMYKPKHPHLLQLQGQLRRERNRLNAPQPAPQAGQREVSAEQRALLREYESSLQTYENLLARRIDATMAERLESAGAMPEIQILREPRLAGRPISPDPLLFAGVGAGLGLGLAALLAMLPALRTRTFSDVDPLVEASGLPVVAVLPRQSGSAEGGGPDPRLVVLARPDSAAAEQMRRALPHLFRTPGTPVALVTSAERDAGKSVCAVNLAATAAANGQRRTLLIDADLRRPSLHALLRLPAGPGLAECVRGEVSLASVTLPTPVPNLFLLRAGNGGDNPVALLEDERMLKLLDTARREFGAVFLDAPPRLPVVDAALLERLATLVLFVVRAEVTPRASVLRGLRGVGLPVGLILNDLRPDAYRRHFGVDPSQPPYARTRKQ